MSINASDIVHRLRLIRSDGVGPVTYKRLMERYGSAEKALLALPELAKPGGKTVIPCSVAKAEAELENLYKAGGRIIALGDANYPELLAMTDDAPPLLSIIGRVELLHKPSLAIVGARNATVNGKRLAQKLATEIGQNGYIIVSGLARGIDTAAHAGSLASGTIAVLAGGVDIIYPPENKDLYQRIAEQGVVLSEMGWGVEPTNQHFPRRNRIISGLCHATILVEAATKSGSLITTRLALEQGREVFAVPGSPLDPRHAGPNHLIKTGQAQLIESAADVLDTMVMLRDKRIIPQPLSTLLPLNDNNTLFEDFQIEYELHEVALPQGDTQAILLSALSTSPTSTDLLAQITGLPVQEVLTILLELELAGRLQRLSGNQVALIAA
jgi:DNA processing protein